LGNFVRVRVDEFWFKVLTYMLLLFAGVFLLLQFGIWCLRI
jgi:hypothetical protein